MSEVLVFERAAPSFAATLAKRGHHIVYRANEANRCPGCGRSHWYIGRVSAECGFCGTAVPLAEASRQEAPRAAGKGSPRAFPIPRTSGDFRACRPWTGSFSCSSTVPRPASPFTISQKAE